MRDRKMHAASISCQVIHVAYLYIRYAVSPSEIPPSTVSGRNVKRARELRKKTILSLVHKIGMYRPDGQPEPGVCRLSASLPLPDTDQPTKPTFIKKTSHCLVPATATGACLLLQYTYMILLVHPPLNTQEVLKIAEHAEVENARKAYTRTQRQEEDLKVSTALLKRVWTLYLAISKVTGFLCQLVDHCEIRRVQFWRPLSGSGW